MIQFGYVWIDVYNYNDFLYKLRYNVIRQRINNIIRRKTIKETIINPRDKQERFSPSKEWCDILC